MEGHDTVEQDWDRLATAGGGLKTLDNIEALIESDGQVTLGYLRPVGCVAVANDESSNLAMLRRRPGESFTALLERLDHAIERAVEYDEYLDEINEP